MIKKQTTKFIGLLMLTICTFGANAAPIIYTGYNTIERVNVNNHFVEILIPESLNPAGCENSSGWYVKNLKKAGAKQMFKLALEAHMNNRQIKLRVLQDKCNAKYPTFDYITVL